MRQPRETIGVGGHTANDGQLQAKIEIGRDWDPPHPPRDIHAQRSHQDSCTQPADPFVGAANRRSQALFFYWHCLRGDRLAQKSQAQKQVAHTCPSGLRLFSELPRVAHLRLWRGVYIALFAMCAAPRNQP